MLIVGSTALKRFGVNRGEPKDIDRWFSRGDENGIGAHDDSVIPCHIYQMLKWQHSNTGTVNPHAIYTIKMSHLPHDIKWEKTKNDIIWLKAKGCQLILPLYHELKLHWETVHGDKSFLSLLQNKDEFFNDFVHYEYDHDYLHEVVASPAQPMYNMCLKDGEAVLTDKAKFCKMSGEDQIRMFREEIAVIALERWVLNPKCKRSIGWYEAHGMALKKTIISLTKNWATDFLIHNLEKFVKPDYSYYKNALNLLGDLQMTDLLNSVRWEEFKDEIDYHSSDDNDLLGNIAEDDVCMDAVTIAKYDFEHLMQEGGGEGGSEYCEAVFRFDGKLYHVEYSYASHCGHDYDYISETLTEVTARKKTVTVYS